MLAFGNIFAKKNWTQWKKEWGGISKNERSNPLKIFPRKFLNRFCLFWVTLAGKKLKLASNWFFFLNPLALKIIHRRMTILHILLMTVIYGVLGYLSYKIFRFYGLIDYGINFVSRSKAAFINYDWNVKNLQTHYHLCTSSERDK